MLVSSSSFSSICSSSEDFSSVFFICPADAFPEDAVALASELLSFNTIPTTTTIIRVMVMMLIATFQFSLIFSIIICHFSLLFLITIYCFSVKIWHIPKDVSYHFLFFGVQSPNLHLILVHLHPV